MYDFVDNMLDNSVDNTKFVMSNNQNTNVLSDYTGLLYLVLRGGSTTASVIYEDDSELLRNDNYATNSNYRTFTILIRKNKQYRYTGGTLVSQCFIPFLP